jgi:hypothetical protein
LSAVWEIKDQFALLEAWLTSGFMPGEWGMGLRDWGMGNGIFTEQEVSPGTVNGIRQFEVINKTGYDWRSPWEIPESVSHQIVANITQQQ